MKIAAQDTETTMMDPKYGKPFIPMDRIEDLVQLEPAVVTVGMVLVAWAFYKIFLRKVSTERHLSLRRHYRRLLVHLGIFFFFMMSYLALDHWEEQVPILTRFMPYFGLLGLFWGALVFIKSSRLVVLQYLFFSHMREGVPIVLVNSFTLCLSIGVYGWLAKMIFNLDVGPLLAGSAILSILLGLALQDTLGNLFAGVSLQFDQAYDIGDWIEVVSSTTGKWVGKVHEISWRATTLTGLSDEVIVIPNRVISQAHVSNFSSPGRPILRRTIFRIPYSAPLAQARECLVQAAVASPQVCRYPAPFTLIDEGGESWVAVKLLYFVEDYGSQWSATDQVVAGVIERLGQAGIDLAAPRLEVSARTTTSLPL